ncbi:MAG TPA: SRPBCC family protein [Actinomycetales bacterium]|nr:SRPBCC family protein [Actinomycetales bacterium]
MSTSTSTGHHETQILVDDKVPVIRIIREFDAPPDKVFRAHVDPDLIVQWLGPRGLEMDIDHYDCRTGGSYRYIHRRGEEQYGFHGSFHEVRPNDLIIQTFTFEGAPDGVSLDRLVLEDLGDGRTRITGTSLVESFETRDAILASGMEVGVREGYERLDELLKA